MKKIILALLISVGCLTANGLYNNGKTNYPDTFSDTREETFILDDISNVVEVIVMFDEINIKVLSYVKHHFNVQGINWNEGFKNSAKGIEGIKYLDEHHGIGLSYITFRNSFNNRTSAGGFVYKYTAKEMFKDFKPNIKLYALYQKGYYGSWDKPLPYDTKTDDKFWSPLISTGFEYKNFTIDVVGTHNTLHAITLGYSFKFDLGQDKI